MGRWGWRKATCSLLRAKQLVLPLTSVNWAFRLLGLSWALSWCWISLGSLRPLEGMVWKKKTIQWLLSAWQWSYTHLSMELAVPDHSESQVHTMPCSAHLGWITVLKQILISMHLIYTFFPPFSSPHWQLTEPFFFLTPPWHSLYQHVKTAGVIHMETSSSVA